MTAARIRRRASAEAADEAAALFLHRLFRSRRSLRTALSATALLSLSLCLPVLMVSNLNIHQNLRQLRRSINSVVVGVPKLQPPAPVRVRQLRDDNDSDMMNGEDDPGLLPRVPPPHIDEFNEPLPPYSLTNVLQAVPVFHDTFAVLVFDPPSNKFVAHYSNSMRWISGCHKLISSLKALSHTLRMMYPERFTSEAPEFALAVGAADYPGLNWNECLRQGRSDCLVDGDGNELQLSPILQFGSVFQQPILPTMLAMPMPQNNHLNCFHHWALHHQVCGYYLPRGETNPIGLIFEETIGVGWDDLIPQVVWRGTDFSYLHKMHPTLRTPNFELDVASQIDLSERIDKKTAATHAMRQVYDELIPRWKGVVWTAEAEREAEAHDHQLLNKRRRTQNGRARRDVLLNKKRARVPNKQTERRQKQEVGQIGKIEKTIPWANIRFAAAMHMGKKTPTKEIDEYLQFDDFGIPAVGEGMSLEELGRYKYHIDLGGGGGTTWSGTIEKLGLPGLLFHHVTPTKDYFHDALVPWVHYVPIKEDLSDLRAKFKWAESHPRMAKQISDNATAFVKRLGTPEGMQEFFERFYGGPLRRVVDAYQPIETLGGGSWRNIMLSIAGDDLRPIMACGGHYQHDCERLVDDLQFTRLHDRDVDMSARKK